MDRSLAAGPHRDVSDGQWRIMHILRHPAKSDVSRIPES